MSFDPNYPPQNAEIESAPLRGQFGSLKTLIDAIQSIIAAQVDGVTTVNPGDPAAATVAIVGNELHFTFAIPRGDEGLPGVAGIDGAQGPPFAQAVVDAVNTLNPGDAAMVSATLDGTNVHLTFGIPPGFNGTNGIDGINGTDGAPGEVTNAALATAISGTSNNTNAVALLSLTVSDPPTQGEMQAIANKLDELILAGRR